MIALLVAQNTFREVVRDRVLIGLVLGGLFLLGFTRIASPLAMGEGLRLTVDLGLSSISWLGLLVVLTVGTALVSKEIDKRTIFNLLSRPLPRPLYLVGKWLGLTRALAAVAAILGVALWLVVALLGHAAYAGSIAQAVFLASLELAVINSLAVMFSALSTPLLSALYTLGFFLAGQWCADLRRFASSCPDGLKTLLEGAANVMPNLPLFNMRTLAASGDLTTWTHLGLASAYAALYCACVLSLAAAAFESRDFK
jgi:ABC-type transport system involved in multi-copper enzyme maturation permease subunit